MASGAKPVLTGRKAVLVAARIGVGLDQILGERPVTGQQHRRPLQRTLTRHHELRETFSLGAHCPSGQLIPLS
jgi:hypothetical protein